MKLNIRCLFGKHDFPSNSIFSGYGAIFKGGYCPRCDKLIQGKFLFNEWAEEIQHETYYELTGVNPKLEEVVRSGKYVWADLSGLEE